ncbi:MAG: hypothetical protein WAQ98_25710 [Blastocatellia bacterium]
MPNNTDWKNEWREAYKADPQSFEPVFLWLRFVKGWSQVEIQELDLDDDEHFALLEEYDRDLSISQMAYECQQEIELCQ